MYKILIKYTNQLSTYLYRNTKTRSTVDLVNGTNHYYLFSANYKIKLF